MKLSTILANVATAIANDSAINTHCMTNYGKAISIYVHIDPKNPPSISNAPWVGLTIQGYRRPIETNVVLAEFDLECAVYCSNSTQTTSGKITTLAGFAALEDLSDLVFTVIETSISTSSTQTNISYRDEQQTSLMVTDFPGWMASRVWTASKHI